MAFQVSGGSGGSGEDEGAGDIFSEINITPLTDVFLVLLIIFMVTSSVMSQMGVSVDLPQASQSMVSAQPEGVVLSLLPEGRLQVNGEAVEGGDWETLRSKLQKAFTLTSSRLVVLEGDRKAFLGSVIEVMDEARQAGAQTFAIAATTDSRKK